MRRTFPAKSRVPIGRSADAAASSLAAEDASALVTLGESVGARIASWHGARAVQIHQFVGAVRVGDLHVEILPKIDGLDGEDAIRRSLLAMLAKTQDLEVRESEAAGFLESAEPLAALLAAERMLEGAAATSAATELRHLLLDVSDARPSREAVARLRTDRMSRRLAPILALAKLLLGNRSPAVGRPGVPRDFVIQGGGAPSVVVRVMTVDLARLESVAAQVGEAVCGELRRL